MARACVSAPVGPDTINNVALTPLLTCPLIVLPSASVTITEGMVIVASPPPISTNTPVALLAMITPTAPAFCAFFTLATKVQVPRSMIAMRPAMAPLFVSAEQASAGEA